MHTHFTLKEKLQIKKSSFFNLRDAIVQGDGEKDIFVEFAEEIKRYDGLVSKMNSTHDGKSKNCLLMEADALLNVMIENANCVLKKQILQSNNINLTGLH